MFKKINNILLVILSSFFIVYFSSFTLFAESEKELVYTGSVVSISKIKAVYNNEKWELFIYWNWFWQEKNKVIVSITDKDWKDTKIPILWVYNNLINANINNDFPNWDIMVVVSTWKKGANNKPILLSSNSVAFDFRLPKVTKIYSETTLWPWENLIVEWENFKKPSYWMMGWEKYICDKESSTKCIFKIPPGDKIKWKLWISSFWFKEESTYELESAKVPDIEVKWVSSNLFVVKVKNYTFEELREIPKNKKDSEAKKLETLDWVKMVVDNVEFDKCEISIAWLLSCIWDKEIYYKWVWYVDIFWSKSNLITYEISDSPQIAKYEIFRKWWSIQKRVKWLSSVVHEWNLLHFKIYLSDFTYALRKNVSIFIDWEEYSLESGNISYNKDYAIIKLIDLPEDKWDMYVLHKTVSLISWDKLIEVRSKAIPYDIWKYLPEVYEVWNTKDENEFYINWENLTNFHDLETQVNFWDIKLDSDQTKRIYAEKKAENNKKIQKAQSTIANATQEEVDEIRAYIKQLEEVNNDIDKWIYKFKIERESLMEWKIIRKSDNVIIVKIFDEEEYWKDLQKWEYDVFVKSNWKDSNKVKFFYNPRSKTNISYAYPVIEKIDFVKWAWNTSEIKLKWNFFQYVKEVYFSDEKINIKSKTNNWLFLNLPSDIQIQWPITAKLENNKLTNSLFIYEFFTNKKNKISVDWKKSDETWDSQDTEPILVIENLYKDVVLKSLSVWISSDLFKSEKLPFYEVLLKQGSKIISRWVFEDGDTIIFESIEFDNVIKVNENKNVELFIEFFEVNNSYWDFKINVNRIEFYDESNIPNIIPFSKVKVTKDPFFHVLNKEKQKFCIEKVGKAWQWLRCWEIQWLTETKDWVFQQKFIKLISVPAIDEKRKTLFSDVYTNYWYYPFVDDLYKRSIVEWYGDRSFRGANNITRWEAIKILLTARSEIIPKYDLELDTFAYEDVPDDYWWKGALEYSVRKGFLRPAKKIYPNKFINRAEAVKLLTTFFERSVSDVSSTYFSDINNHWVINYAQYLYKHWIISWVWNKNIFNPNWLVTRAEFSKMISKAIWLWGE